MEILSARTPYSACPLCDANDRIEVMLGDCSRHRMYKPVLPKIQRWMQCANCRHIFVDGYFTPDALEVLFSDTHDFQSVGFEIANQRTAWSHVLDTVGTLRSSLGGAGSMSALAMDLY